MMFFWNLILKVKTKIWDKFRTFVVKLNFYKKNFVENKNVPELFEFFKKFPRFKKKILIYKKKTESFICCSVMLPRTD